MKELGVTIIGGHISSDSMYNEKKLEAFLDYQQAVGCGTPACPWISSPTWLSSRSGVKT